MKRTMNDLIKDGFVTDPTLIFLDLIMRANLTFVITGTIGSGKTTLLNAMMDCIPENDKTLVVEREPELKISESYKRVSALDYDAFKMRPNRIVVGELRPDICPQTFEAILSGYGVAGTYCCDSFDRLMKEFKEYLKESGEFGAICTEELLPTCLDVLVQVNRLPDGTRKVTRIAELNSYGSTEGPLHPLFEMRGGELVRVADSLKCKDKILLETGDLEAVNNLMK